LLGWWIRVIYSSQSVSQDAIKNLYLQQTIPKPLAMKKIFLSILSLLFVNQLLVAQTASDFFTPSRIRYMGIDYSHVKLIGDFSEFMGAGEATEQTMRKIYFPGWNTLFQEEPDKYNVKSMIKKGDVVYDFDMVNSLNAKSSTEPMEATKTPVYTKEDIQKFIRNYGTMQREGIAVLFIAESLNKTANEAYFHFVAFRLADNEILIHERLRGEPKGAGLRNYWAGAIYDIMEDIKKNRYNNWKSKYAK
jgi:hypothetical protein